MDDTLLGSGGRRWVLTCGRSTCRVERGVGCAKHDLVDLIPVELPRQVRHREPTAYPPVDMDAGLRFGHHSGGTFSGLSGG